MVNCKNCPFYDAEYDELRQSGNDYIVIGEENIEKHYCVMYENNIPQGIVDDTELCEYLEEVK